MQSEEIEERETGVGGKTCFFLIGCHGNTRLFVIKAKKKKLPKSSSQSRDSSPAFRSADVLAGKKVHLLFPSVIITRLLTEATKTELQPVIEFTQTECAPIFFYHYYYFALFLTVPKGLIYFNYIPYFTLGSGCKIGNTAVRCRSE